MKTFWRLAVTFAVLGLFVLIVSFALAAVMSGFSMPSLSGGDIAVIPVHGTITLGGCPGSLFTSSSCAEVEVIKQQLKEADEDYAVKAIVLDIYSGGGNVVASRELMRAVRKTEKPVVAWVSEIGTSGAYYTASAADKIVADDNSMTGGIGVIMFIEHYYGLMDWLGVNVTVIKAGDSKDLGSPYRPMTEDEHAELEGMINKVYASFVSDVALNRGLELEYVKSVSKGKVYLGSEAYELGLVDELGGFDRAIEVAAKEGGITGEPGIRRSEHKISWVDLLR